MFLSLLLRKELLRFSYGIKKKGWFKEEVKYVYIFIFNCISLLQKSISTHAHTHAHTHARTHTHPPAPPQLIKELVRTDAEVRGFPGGPVDKKPPATQETRVRSLGWEDSMKEESAASSSKLAWRVPWTEEHGGLQSMGSQRVRHD